MKKFIFYLLFFTFVFNIEGNSNESDPFKQDVEEVFNQLKALDIKKATTFQNIPCKSLKENAEVCTPVLTNIINNEFRSCSFPNKLKEADITPIFKNDRKRKKKIEQEFWPCSK